MRTKEKILLVGCGILKKEINFLIKKNNWQIDTCYLHSLLHINFSKLSKNLHLALNKNKDRHKIAFYGCCHPDIDSILDERNTPRTMVQNCIEILLGKEIFEQELEKGAYFLLDEWAKNWPEIISKTYGTNNPDLIKELFHEDRKFILGLRTPCSNDFTYEAEHASKFIGLPLKWIDVSLDHLEYTLRSVITSKVKELECQNQTTI